MKVLVVGSGGREHALAWAIGRSPRVDRMWIAPGNAGTAGAGENVDIGATDVAALVDFAREQRIDLTVVGPEAPLLAGIVDRFRASGLSCYGPTAAAARLEGSKAFAKDFMRRRGIPTAAFATFEDAARARSYARSLGAPVVVKADGLAAGKGVVVAADVDEAERAIDAMLVEQRFGEAGSRVVVEEFLQGEEVSVHAVCAGGHALLLPSSQDHKRAYDGDRGPNTGGMGAIAPVPWVDAVALARVEREVVRPVLDGMAAEGTPFTGTLYAGIMWTEAGPKVLEFNARFGDPETQSLMPLLVEGDVCGLLASAANGNLPEGVKAAARSAATIVVASKGYPESAQSGVEIRGHDAAEEGTMVFHAGTRVVDGRVVTAGGRVLGITGWAPTLSEALGRAYRVAARIHIDGAFYRSDIGRRHL
ncbi:MAG TPA: phosphoribosylamine--glycine ligase [Candidatus Krumholzibacteria bacterium]|nr:phosphoribosylamine--glycine ligase [Candidatus Krumholzibacteria bacterium]